MNPEAEAKLKEIRSKSPESLNEDEKAFLRARSSYLGPNSRKKFASILNAKPEVKEDPAPQEKESQDQAETTKKGKKNNPVEELAHPADAKSEDEDDDPIETVESSDDDDDDEVE